jgi:hypothetical protein
VRQDGTFRGVLMMAKPIPCCYENAKLNFEIGKKSASTLQSPPLKKTFVRYQSAFTYSKNKQ